MMMLVYILGLVGAVLLVGSLITATMVTRGPFVYMQGMRIFGAGAGFIAIAVIIWQAEEIERLQLELRQAYTELNQARDCESRITGYDGLVTRFKDNLIKCRDEVIAAQKLQCPPE